MKRLNMEVKCLNMDVKPWEKFQVSDYSHNLQEDETKGDLNCSLYSRNFSRSLFETLRDDREARELFAIPAVSDENVREKIINGMKARLPEYYMRNADGKYQEVDPSSKRRTHLELRWEAGNAFFRYLAASQQTLELPSAPSRSSPVTSQTLSPSSQSRDAGDPIGPPPLTPPVEGIVSLGPPGTGPTEDDSSVERIRNQTAGEVVSAGGSAYRTGGSKKNVKKIMQDAAWKYPKMAIQKIFRCR